MMKVFAGIDTKLNSLPESSNYLSISVIIPCFRCAKTINRAIDSVLQQTNKPAEVILVDDASGNETACVLRQIEQQYPDWITVITLPKNSGAASARNAGWAVATQPYIAFLDADDSWHPEKLHIQHEYMRNNPDVVLCGHHCVWLRTSDKPPALLADYRVTRISGNSLLYKNAFSTPTVMLRCDVPFRFQEGIRYLEDLLLWQQLAMAGLPIVRIEKVLAYVHKPFYGVGGLSAQLWKMEKGELRNIKILYCADSINFAQYISASIFSLIKFFKRIFVTFFNKNMQD